MMGDRGLGNYNSCCRLCLSEKSDSLKSVFDDKSGKPALVRKISTFVGVTINIDDRITTMICNQCIKQINNWHSYKQQCTANQQKLLDWMRSWNATVLTNTSVQIKDEPDETRENVDVTIDDDDDEPVAVKTEPVEVDSEPMEEEDPDLSPLIPDVVYENNDMETEVNLGNGNDSEQVVKSSRHCTICNKVFSTAGNRKKHERMIHGINDKSGRASKSMENSEKGSNNDEGSQHSLDSQSHSLTTPNDLQARASPYQSHPNSINSQNDTNRETPNIETDREKIVFAAGLKLQQRNATPQEVVLDANGLTRIELSYVEKCKAMVVMFETLICSCHNAPHKSVKRLFSHLRSLRIWFPIYTCYNCMITFTDRSTNMKHKGCCKRKPLEHLIRLGDLRKNDELKRRLYQIFKCVKCKFLFSFYDDFCEHADSDHVPAGPPFVCSCQKVFKNANEYKEHIHKSCLINYYCDICFTISSNLDEFEAHCKEIHDVSEGFTLLQEDNYQQRKHYSRSEYSPTENELIVPKSNKPAYIPQIEIETYEYTTPEHRPVYNLNSWSKSKPSACPVCGKVYSNYHNMLRHLKTHDESEKTIPCYECPEKFRLMAELKQHKIEVHNNEEGPRDYMFSCPDCGDIYRSLQEWNQHKESHEVQVCLECGKEFIFKTELEQHRSVHLNLKVYRDSKTQAYRSTIVSPSNVVLMCEVCDKMFTTKEELKEHKTIHDQMPILKAENGLKEEEEKQDLSKKYSCTLCNKHYLGYGGLWDHNKKKHPGRQIAHDYPRKCKYCEKLLYTGGSWVIHKRMHERLLQQEQNRPSTSQETLPTTTPKTAKPNNRSDEDQEDAESYHTCKRCFKVFSSKYNLKNHMKSHGIHISPSRTQTKNNKQVWCDICHQACQGPEELQRHKLEHENENMPEIQNEEDDVEMVKPQIYVCDLCEKHFLSKNTLRKHKEDHMVQLSKAPSKKDYVFCKYCKIPFSDNEALNEHMIDEHNETLIKPRMKESQNKKYPCNFCRKTFDTAGALCSHQGWHKRGGKAEKQLKMEHKLYKKMTNNIPKHNQHVPRQIFQCKRCNAEFSNDTALQIHILEKHRNVNATVVLPRCTQCNVEFDSTEAYDKHKQLHLIVEKKKEMKQHPCQYCPSAFSRSDTLTAHIKQHHGQFLAKNFKCHVCDRLFEKQNALTIHLKTHDRQRLSGHQPNKSSLPKGLSCSICQIVFPDSKELRNHIFSAHPF